MAKFEKLKLINVLYVEDEVDIRDEIVDMLSLRVQKLFVSQNGQEGYESYLENKPDIIITDIKMPILDGIGMIEKIRKIDSDIPIIITSAFNDSDFFKKAIELHVDKYITKPIDFQQLLSTLDRAALVVYQKQELNHKDAMLKNREKILALSELMESIAHHWRQPLSVISTSASAILVAKEFGTLSDEVFIKSCETINKTTQNLSKTIDTFRNFFTRKDTQETINIKDLINDYLNIIKPLFEDKNIKIETNLEDLELHIEKNDFNQVLSILLNNSKDILLLKNPKEKYIQINLTKRDNEILFSILDSGGGVEIENIYDVFKPYYTTKHAYSGTGLGLFIVHEIVKNSFCGTIEVSNEKIDCNGNEYQGAKFMICFINQNTMGEIK